jgi:hypothetical protein
MRISRLTTVERDNLSPSPSNGGYVIFNTTTDKYQVFNENTLLWENIASANEIPIYLDEFSTFADLQANRRHIYIGNAPLTIDLDTAIPYPLPVPTAQNLVIANQSFYVFEIVSGGFSSGVSLPPLYSTVEGVNFDDFGNGYWEISYGAYITAMSLQQVIQQGNTTRDAFFVVNNPDTYRTRYSTIGTQIQRDDLGNRINYSDLGIELTRSTGNKTFAINLPDITANAINSSFTVDFRPNLSGTVAYLSDITGLGNNIYNSDGTIVSGSGSRTINMGENYVNFYSSTPNTTQFAVFMEDGVTGKIADFEIANQYMRFTSVESTGTGGSSMRIEHNALSGSYINFSSSLSPTDIISLNIGRVSDNGIYVSDNTTNKKGIRLLGFGETDLIGTGASYTTLADNSLVPKKYVDDIINLRTITTITANTTLLSQYTALVDSTSGNITISLPPAASNNGRIYNIKKIVAVNSVIIDPNLAETIDGNVTITLVNQWEAVTIQSNGVSWFILASF